MSDTVDVVVIGTGPGGEALAQSCAEAGLEVLAVERHLVGGECPYYACIPTKAMVRAADTVAEARRAGELAGRVEVAPAWGPVARRVSSVTAGWDDAAAVERLSAAGVRVVHGTGRLDGPARVRATPADGSGDLGVTVRRGVVLCPGTRPAVPPVEGLAETPYWTNRDVVRATELPGSLAVLGGGPIGAELSQVLARFGVRVTVLQRGERLLPRDEPEASALLADALGRDGVEVRTGVEVTRVTHDGGFTIELADGTALSTDGLLVATGRTPNLDDLGLESVGLDPADVRVDDRMRLADGLWLVGDAAGQGAYTHLSMRQAEVARRDLLGEDPGRVAGHAVPHVTFTDPEVAGVGLTEQAARDAGVPVATGSAGLGSRGFLHRTDDEPDGLVKVVADTDRGVLVGATVVGPYAGEVLGALALAVHAELPLEALDGWITAFPTFHRAIPDALADLG